jgi:hypothetical protein
MPKFLFPRKVSSAAPSDVVKYSPAVQLGDQLYDQVVVLGTTYKTGFLVITKMYSPDVIEVGEILKIILRKGSVLLLLLLSDAARNSLGFFQALPKDTASLISYDSLVDYKPIIKRGDQSCYPFVLHHHVSHPSVDDGE